MEAEPAVVLAIAFGDDGLTVTARPQSGGADGEQWFDVAIQARAHPFNGTVTTILTGPDLLLFREEVERLSLPGEATLGGGRAAELRLHVEHQVGGTPGLLAVAVELSPSGEDPYPALRWLLFDVSPSFTTDVVNAIARVVAPS